MDPSSSPPPTPGDKPGETPLPIQPIPPTAVQGVLQSSTTSATPKADARMLAASRMNKINSLWEITQAVLAIALTAATIYVCVRVTPVNDGNGNLSFAPVPETLKNALFVVLGFYFGRTNHARPTPTDDQGEGGTGQGQGREM